MTEQEAREAIVTWAKARYEDESTGRPEVEVLTIKHDMLLNEWDVKLHVSTRDDNPYITFCKDDMGELQIVSVEYKAKGSSSTMASFQRIDPDGDLNTGKSVFIVADSQGRGVELSQQEAMELMGWLRSFLEPLPSIRDQQPALSIDTKTVLYFLLRDAMKEGGALGNTFASLYIDEVEAEKDKLTRWEQIQREIALFSGWCFQGTHDLEGKQLSTDIATRKLAPDYDVRNQQQESAWWDWAGQATDDELLAALRHCSSWSDIPAFVTRTRLGERGYAIVGTQPSEVTLEREEKQA